MDKKLLSHTALFRTSIIKNMMFLISAVCFLLSIIEITKHNLIEMSALIALGCNAIFIHRQCQMSTPRITSIQFFSFLFIVTLSFNAYFLSYEYNEWVCISPFIFYLLLGNKQGLLFTATTLFIQITILCYKILFDNSPILHSHINLYLIFSIIWVIIHLYETRRILLEKSLISLASQDPLTGAYNRLSLTNTFNHYTENRHNLPTLHLLILDIDYFKQVNDKYGHDIGDKVLIETSLLIGKITGDTNLFRIGGEEFCVTIFNNRLNEAQAVSEHLRQSLQDHIFCFGALRFQITISVGICVYREGDSLLALIKMADNELYKAKNSGRNQVRICQNDSKQTLCTEQTQPRS